LYLPVVIQKIVTWQWFDAVISKLIDVMRSFHCDGIITESISWYLMCWWWLSLRTDCYTLHFASLQTQVWLSS